MGFLTTGKGAGGVPGDITLPDFGGGQVDNALRAGWMAASGNNPYYPDGNVSNGNLSLGGAGPNTPQPIGPPPVDTDFAGGMPDIITGSPSPTAPPGSSPGSGGGGDPFAPPYPGTNDTSWDWGQGPVTGEYFGSPPTMNAQTMPGGDSPWGVPGTPGGNNDFYRQQFSNLLTQQNASQKAQIVAALRREANENAPPQEPTDMNQFWADRGVTPSQAAQSGADGGVYKYDLMPGIEKGATSNRDLVNLVGGQEGFSKKEMGYWDDFWKASPDAAEKTNWSTYGTPQAGISSIDPGLNEGWQDRFSTLYNSMLNRTDITTPVGGGPKASPGYALPVSQAGG